MPLYEYYYVYGACMSNNLLRFSANLDREQLLASQPKSKLSCHVNIESNVIAGVENEIATTANICLLFDCSFSMSGKKFETAVKTAKMIVDILHERHSLSLLAFQTRCNTVFKNQVPTENAKELIKHKIDNIHDHLGGSTNMTAGIKSAMDILEKSTADADVIVLLSDGVADSPEHAQLAAEQASERGIQLFAVGIGEAYDAEQLLELVKPSNGTVFGDSEGDKINKIFYDIINRIDQIYASKAKLDFIFDESVHLKRVYKTSPERFLYNSLSLDSDHKLDLRVGNIENNKSYEFLLNLEVGQHDVGALELIKARLQYDVNRKGETTQQVQEIVLTVNYTDDDTLTSDTNQHISSAINKASIVQLSDDLMQACDKSDNAQALQALNKLQKKCEEENNSGLQQHLDSIKMKLENGHKVSAQDRNDFLVASSKAPPNAAPSTSIFEATTELVALPDAETYDFILIDPGVDMIRLLREIRNTTNMSIPEIADIIKTRNSRVTVFKDKKDAESFQQRLVDIGAIVKIQMGGVINKSA